MGKRTRRYLFYGAVLLFLTVSYFMVRYSFGYIFDVSSLSFVRTGTIHVTVNTTQAEVFINNERIGRTSLLSDSVADSNIVPGTYALTVRKQDYRPYAKELDVGAGEAAFVAATLFKDEYQPEEYAHAVNVFVASRGFEPVFYGKNEDELFFGNEESVFRFDGVDVERVSVPRRVILDIERFLFDENRVFLKTDAALYVVEETRVPFAPVATFSGDITVARDALYIADENGAVSVIEDGGNTRKLLVEPFLEDQQVKKLFVSSAGAVYIITDREVIYSAHEDGVPARLPVRGTEILFAYDETKFLVLSGNELYAVWIEDEFYPQVKNTGSHSLLIRLQDAITDAWWYKNSSVVLFTVDDALYSVEVDGIGGRNQYELFRGISAVTYESGANRLIFTGSDRIRLHEVLFE